jgi:hypothetical protein
MDEFSYACTEMRRRIRSQKFASRIGELPLNTSLCAIQVVIVRTRFPKFLFPKRHTNGEIKLGGVSPV